jgi:hypothetical protein
MPGGGRWTGRAAVRGSPRAGDGAPRTGSSVTGVGHPEGAASRRRLGPARRPLRPTTAATRRTPRDDRRLEFRHPSPRSGTDADGERAFPLETPATPGRPRCPAPTTRRPGRRGRDPRHIPPRLAGRPGGPPGPAVPAAAHLPRPPSAGPRPTAAASCAGRRRLGAGAVVAPHRARRARPHGPVGAAGAPRRAPPRGLPHRVRSFGEGARRRAPLRGGPRARTTGAPRRVRDQPHLAAATTAASSEWAPLHRPGRRLGPDRVAGSRPRHGRDRRRAVRPSARRGSGRRRRAAKAAGARCGGR